MISSSRLDLAERCPGAFTLPWRDSPNDHSDAGNDRHAADEDAINSGEGIEEYTERWPGLEWRAEVAYAYDISSDTARFLGVGVNRNYGALSPFEVPGTIDAEGRGSGRLVVVDRKGFERQEPASRHRQVRFLALAAARAQEAGSITVAIRPEIGPMDIDEIDPMFDLDVIAHEVKQLVLSTAKLRSDAREGAAAPFSVGRHCRWCPAFDECPEQKELRALVVREDKPTEIFVDDETAADAFDLWKRLGIMHKRLGEQLHRFAATRPIRLSNGNLWGQQPKLGNERLDGDAVWQAVKELHPGLEDQAVERKATKKRLEETLKGRRGAAKQVLELVRKRGGASNKQGFEFVEYQPGPRLLSETDGEP